MYVLPDLDDTNVTDSADINSNQPLYQNVRDRLEVWRSIGTPPFILDWIENGVSFPLLDTPTPFYHT